MPELTCIIPVLGDTEGLETTLVSVLEHRPDNCEVLVVLNTPYQDPYNLHEEIRFLEAPPTAGLVACVNRGIAAAQAPIVHVLAKGMEASDGWIQRALQHFEDPRVAAVAPVIYSAIDQGHLLAAGVGYRRGGSKIVCRSLSAANESRLTPVGPSIQAAFYRKAALASLGGGLPTAVGDALADVDLALSLRKLGWRLVLEPQCRVIGSAVDNVQPAGFRAGLGAERLFWRHLAAGGWLRGLLAHPLVAFLEVVRSNPWWKAPAQTIGRMLALCQLGHYRQFQQLLTAAKREAIVTQSQRSTAQQRIAVVADPQSANQQHRLDAPHTTLHTAAARKQHGSRRQRSRG